MGQMINPFSILVRKTEVKRPLKRPMFILDDNIRMYLREVEWNLVDWMHVIHGRDQWRIIVNTVMNQRIPYQTYLYAGYTNNYCSLLIFSNLFGLIKWFLEPQVFSTIGSGFRRVSFMLMSHYHHSKKKLIR